MMATSPAVVVAALLVSLYTISITVIAWRWRRHITKLNRRIENLRMANNIEKAQSQNQLALANQQMLHWRSAFGSLSNRLNQLRDDLLLKDGDFFSNPTIDNILKNIERQKTAPSDGAPGEKLDNAIKLFQKGDYVAAHEELLPFAESGNTRAQTLLAKLYFAGHGVARNMETYWHWLERAAENGDRSAKAKLKHRKRTPRPDIIISSK